MWHSCQQPSSGPQSEHEHEHEQYEKEKEKYESEYVTYSVCGVPYEHYRCKVTHRIGRTAVEQHREQKRREEKKIGE